MLPNMTDSDDQTEHSGDSLEAARREKLRKIAALGIDPWGGRFDDHRPIGEIRARESEIVTSPLEAGQRHAEQKGPRVRAAGRLVLMRDTGKLIFADIRDWSGQIQLYIGKKQVGDQNWELAQCFDLGDLIGVDGELKHTQKGELTIFVDQLHFLGKSLETPPDKFHGLNDPELRQRLRYLDLIHTEGVLPRFLNRTKIVQSIRQTLAGERFVEVEGPTLHSIAGGAAAKPFITHHNTLDMKLFLRIALELHLKRLLVGGVERVYELGRVYRNEGISPRHNPEFTMLELYQAYGDYRSMMDLTEKLICNAIKATGQDYKLQYGDATIDFTPPFARETYHELILEHTGVSPDDHAAIRRLAQDNGIEVYFEEDAFSPDRPIDLEKDSDAVGLRREREFDLILSDVFEELVEKKLKGPVFVMDYPASICPLTKRKRNNPEIAERFELFIQGMELANAYTELNDPDLQEELFRTQLAGQKEEDSMAKMDHDFIRALRHGMPPAGGLGIGIDRLVMLLTNSTTIRDVILFPLLRPES